MTRPMPGPFEALPALEQHLAEHLRAFNLLDEAWPKERGFSGGWRSNVL